MLTLVPAVVGVGGCTVLVVRGARDGDDFPSWLAAADAIVWLGLLLAGPLVDNRRRRAVDGKSKRLPATVPWLSGRPHSASRERRRSLRTAHNAG